MKQSKIGQLCYQIGGLVFILLSLTIPSLGQAKKGSSPAQAAYDAGVAAQKKGDNTTAAAEFRKAIELDHDFIDAHLDFLLASLGDFQLPPDELNAKRLEVTKLYDDWGRKWTEEARTAHVGSLAGGEETYGEYEEQAFRMEGSWAIVLARGFTADMMSGGIVWEGYLRTAVMLKPEIADHLLRMAEEYSYPEVRVKCAFALRLYRHDQYAKLVDTLIADYPNDQATMAALYSLAEEAETVEQRIKFFERIRSDFSRLAYHNPAMENTVNPYSSSLNSYNLAMWDLFGAYLKTDQSKALGLAEEMSKANPADRGWATVRSLQEIIASKPFELDIDHAKPQVAVLLADMAASEYGSSLPTREEAYEFLSNLIAKRNQAEPYQSSLYKLGEKLKKTHQQVDKELWQLRTKNARQVKDFELATYDGKKVKLSNYRGKVVLLNLWAPS